MDTHNFIAQLRLCLLPNKAFVSMATEKVYITLQLMLCNFVQYTSFLLIYFFIMNYNTLSFLSIFVDEKVKDDISLTTENIENLNFNLLVGIIVLSVLLLNTIIICCFILFCR